LLIILIYSVLEVILVRNIANGQSLSQLKSVLDPFSKSNTSQVSNGLTLFLYMLGNSNNSNNANAGVFQVILLIMISLAIIWGLRQAYNSIHARVRDAFYRGMYPLVMFVLVIIVIGLQFLPFILGATLYNLVISNGIAAFTIEKWLWALLFFFMALATIYMICSSVFALYIVTLPDMTPMKALRSARELVMHRRWEVLRKLIFLPIALIIIATLIMVPLLLITAPVAVWVFFIMTIVGLVVAHSYVYALYRELLL
jgi:heme/copper-type cytochrome/quinol oxidase subunit 4